MDQGNANLGGQDQRHVSGDKYKSQGYRVLRAGVAFKLFVHIISVNSYNSCINDSSGFLPENTEGWIFLRVHSW